MSKFINMLQLKYFKLIKIYEKIAFRSVYPVYILLFQLISRFTNKTKP